MSKIVYAVALLSLSLTPACKESKADGPAAAPVYTLRSSDGEVLKLTAPADVAKLAELTGKRVQIDGRRLFLALVDGPVLVIDRVTVAGAAKRAN